MKVILFKFFISSLLRIDCHWIYIDLLFRIHEKNISLYSISRGATLWRDHSLKTFWRYNRWFELIPSNRGVNADMNLICLSQTTKKQIF